MIRYTLTGLAGEFIPREATHVVIHKSVSVIPEGTFQIHRNIVEVLCHAGVIKN